MATNIQPYVDQAQVFLEQAYSEMQAGDLRQASEKGWGAASLMVKAVAEKQGEGHSRHRSLYKVVGNLANRTGDQEYRRLFAMAGELHSNFYEDFLESEDIAEHIRSVEKLIEKLREWL